MRRVAAVDLGTNSTRLLIADAGREGLADVERIEQVTGLGQGVDGSGHLAPASIERTIRVLAGYGRLIREAGVERARGVATSATRGATNRNEFLDLAYQALGFRPDVIGGEEEADLAFAGATARSADPAETVVVDIGGGSTEIVTDRGGRSIDIGSIRLTERCLPAHPATAYDLEDARREAARVIGVLDLPHRRNGMGTAGTWTTLAAMHSGLDTYDAETVEGVTLGLADLEKMVEWLGALRLDEKRAIPTLDPLRAPIILGGAIIAETTLKILGLDEITVTGYDLLDGVCLSLAASLSRS